MVTSGLAPASARQAWSIGSWPDREVMTRTTGQSAAVAASEASRVRVDRLAQCKSSTARTRRRVQLALRTRQAIVLVLPALRALLSMAS
jgi:hypothetical protein